MNPDDPLSNLLNLACAYKDLCNGRGNNIDRFDPAIDKLEHLIADQLDLLVPNDTDTTSSTETADNG